ncbi:hypothetical protein [Nostoc sp. MS1]|nr:hypothetical protein [Nostoc sp. MS1]BCL34572.1 hypothetical protein NSMS1_10190 [Nostoc sp. MS1]
MGNGIANQSFFEGVGSWELGVGGDEEVGGDEGEDKEAEENNYGLMTND